MKTREELMNRIDELVEERNELKDLLMQERFLNEKLFDGMSELLEVTTRLKEQNNFIMKEHSKLLIKQRETDRLNEQLQKEKEESEENDQ